MNARFLVIALLLVLQSDANLPATATRNAVTAGAKADGVADDTATIQSILDGFSEPFTTGVLELPGGTYRITRPLVYRGDYGYGVRIRGVHSAAQLSGTVLKWDGPPGGVVLELRGCTSTTVEHLAIDCAGKARAGIAITYDDENKKGTSGVYLDHLYINGGVGPNSAAVVTGYRPDGTRDDRQCDRIILSNSTFVGSGDPGTTQYGFLAGWANCKNFAVRDCGFVGFGTGIKFGGSGYMIVDGFAGGSQTITDFEGTTGNFEIRAGNSEQSTRLFTGATGSNPGSVTISNFSWASASTPGDGVIISYQGYLKLTGCDLRDYKWPGAVPLVRLDVMTNAPASLDSSGNYYANMTGQLPVIDGRGKLLGPPHVRSFGDYGGVVGSLVYLRGIN